MTVGVKRPAPETAQLPNKKVGTRGISSLLADIEAVFQQRETEKENALTEWEQQGMDSEVTSLIQGHIGTIEEHWFPPLADPAQWQLLMDDMIGLIERDEWKMDELHGDRLMAEIAVSLFNKYGLPHCWSSALVSVLLSNDYQKKVASTQGLDVLINSTVEKRSADALEVVIILVSLMCR
jgi:hypothetical protein